MPDMRLLRDLQVLDQQLTSAFNRIRIIKTDLEDRSQLMELEKRISEATTSNQKLVVQHKDFELRSMSLKEKAEKVEKKLYGGSVFNPRELGDLNQELVGLNKDIGSLDEQMLELMLNMDVYQSQIGEGERKLEETTVIWANEHKSLTDEKQELTSAVSRLTGQREKLIKTVNPKGLIAYERLRATKIKDPVAEIMGNICGVCRVTLPTHRVQLAKGGKEPILCTSCGRILYAL